MHTDSFATETTEDTENIMTSEALQSLGRDRPVITLWPVSIPLKNPPSFLRIVLVLYDAAGYAL